MKLAIGIAIGVASILLIGVVSCMALVGGAVSTMETPPEEFTPQDPASESSEQEPSPVVNDTDGVFTYEITGSANQDSFVDYMDTTLNPDNATFFVVDITATNSSSSPATAPDPWMLEHVVAIDTEGQEHLVDDEPWSPDLSVNPGASVSYQAVWDLPENVEIEYVELSASNASDVAVLEIP